MLYFIYGKDAFRAKQRLDGIIKKAKEKNPQLEVRKVDATKSDFAKLEGEMGSFGLFGGTTLWVIKYPLEAKSENIKHLLAFLKRAPESFAAVFYHPRPFTVKNLPKTHKEFYDWLRRNAREEVLKPLKGKELMSWTRQYTREKGVDIEPQALQVVTEGKGPETWAIVTELHKLAAYGGGTIDMKAVRELSQLEVDPVIFNLLDAIGEKNLGKALYYFEQMWEQPEKLVGGSKSEESGQKQEHEQSLPFYLVAMFAYALRNLLQVKEMQDAGADQAQMKTQLGLHPFVLKKTSAQARNFTISQLQGLFAKLRDLDTELKKSPAPKPVIVQAFIAKAVNA